MSIFLDRKYILQIAPSLRNFKQKNENLFNFSCPFCGDSKTKERKARGYVFAHEGSYRFKCHNCIYATNMYGLLKHVGPSLYSQYCLESFNNSHIVTAKQPKIIKSTSMFNDLKILPLECIGGLQNEHWVLDYVKYRCIPERFWSRLYFAPDFREFVDSFYPEHSKNLPLDDPRLVIPFYNEHNILVGFQGRTLRNSDLRYITIKIVDDALKVYGMNTVDLNETIYVLEGPIDSMFLPNAVATCDSDLTKAAKFLPKDKLVLIFDNQYWHKEVRRLLEKAIDQGFQVCIFPKTTQEKDLNDLARKGLTIIDIRRIVNDYTFSNLRAKMELSTR